MSDQVSTEVQTPSPDQKLKDAIKSVAPEVCTLLQQAQACFNKVADILGGVGDSKGEKWYSKKALQAAEFAASYDPKAKKAAKIAKLQAMLKKLEEEVAKEA